MSDIYMGYLTESEREELLFEKEMDLINTDIEYLFTTYEAVDEEKKKNIIIRMYEKIKKLIERLIEIINNKIFKNKKPVKSDITTSNTKTDEKSKQNDKITISSKDYKLFKEYEKLYKKECKFIDKIQKLSNNVKLFNRKTLDELNMLNDELLKDLSNIESTNYEDKQIICPEKNIHEKVVNLNKEVLNTLNEYNEFSDSLKDTMKTGQFGIILNSKLKYEYDKAMSPDKNIDEPKYDSIYSGMTNAIYKNINSVMGSLVTNIVKLNL